ncbi:MAG TPA: Yip1 family protein [Caulobacteraceae bacterium]|jgi:hypothetical protein|nr:Yip1 family protein [Caulobacteraceae bacterium]
MTVTENEPVVPRAAVERAKNILIKPAAEWSVIDAEPATIQGIYRNYLVYLAAIGPVARFIGDVVFSHASVLAAVVVAVITYVVWLVVIYVMGLVIDALAPNFGGEKNPVQAFKVAAYSSTASAVTGVFAIVPALSGLAILGLYGLYLLWLGLPKLMKVPQEKALQYYAVLLGVLLVAGLVIGAVLAPVMMMTRFGI